MTLHPMLSRIRLTTLVFAALALVSASASAAHPRQIQVRGVGKILINVPAGYSLDTSVNAEGITVVKMENPVWGIIVSAGIFPDNDRANTTSKWQNNRLVGFLADLLAESDAVDYSFTPLYPNHGSGQFCVFTEDENTDNSADPENYRHLTAGIKAWGGTTIIFQILSKDITTPEYEEMMNVFVESFEPA